MQAAPASSSHPDTYIPDEHIKWLRRVSGLPAAGHAWVEDTTRAAWTLVTSYSLPRWRGDDRHGTPGERWLSTS